MSTLTWATVWPYVVGAVAVGAVAVGAALWRIGARIVPVLRRIGHLVDDLIGEPPRPGNPTGTPGLLEQVQELRCCGSLWLHCITNGFPGSPGCQGAADGAANTMNRVALLADWRRS